MGTVQKADPAARRKALAIVCAGVLLGFCAIGLFEIFASDIIALIQRNLHLFSANPLVVLSISMAFLSPLLAGCICFLILGNRTVRAQRFPPPGCPVVRDTPVLEGASGVRRGRIMQLLSVILLLCIMTVPFWVWGVFRALA